MNCIFSVEVVLRAEAVETAQAGDKSDFTGTLIVIPDVSTISTPGKVRNIKNNGVHIFVLKFKIVYIVDAASFSVLKLCLLICWKYKFWFLFSNFNFPWPDILRFLHNVFFALTLNLVNIPCMVPELCPWSLLLEDGHMWLNFLLKHNPFQNMWKMFYSEERMNLKCPWLMCRPSLQSLVIYCRSPSDILQWMTLGHYYTNTTFRIHCL